MKIEYLDDDKVIPGIGLMEYERIYDVPDQVGRNLIDQNQAREVSEVVVPKEERKAKKKRT